MSKTLLVDTDVLIDFLCGLDLSVNYIREHSRNIILSVITVAELYSFIKGEHDQHELDEFISLFPVVPITPEIVKIGGLYKRNYAKANEVGLTEAIIAATAEVQKASLITLNVMHYPMLKDVESPYVRPKNCERC